ncbi:uncharacterized protein UTRI_10314 [Ustilago trichophora]|uniref:HTH CENPB-type domain-containing protein n=1 Tax=Ustilago trichophora TaxID=86804 RepID=A0A5C3EN17_9BASI|nr:uncharacterized protein UTRI_10314 [Ustilago trichophora]
MPQYIKKNTHTTLQQRLEIAKYKARHPAASQKEMQDWFFSKFDLKISQPTLSRILNTTQIQNIPTHQLSRKNLKSAANTTLENALFQWFSINQHKINITNNILQIKAKDFAAKLASTGNLTFSIGWVERFKKRFHIQSRIKHGEAASIPRIQQEKILELKEEISNYQPDDIYNMDETGLFFRLQGQHALTNTIIPGFKTPKDRITIVICSNSTGNHKLPLWIIGKFANPRAFKSIKNTNRLPAIYKSNKKAWMNSILFKEWIYWLDNQVKRPILLLMDNFKAHNIDYNLKNIKILLLPPNTTAQLQPLDAGIIKAFKSHYRWLYGLQLLDDLNLDQNQSKNKIGQINVLEALFLASEAWESVNMTTIYNCFRHTGLFHQYNSRNARINEELHKTQEQLQQLQLQLPMALRMDINSLLNHPLEAARTIDITTLDDDDIVDMVSQEEEEAIIPEIGIPAIKTDTAIKNIKELQQFVMGKVENDENAKLYCMQLQSLLREIQAAQLKNAKQTKISQFFQTSQ